MKKITVSAPGKLMLFGEHAVLYGHPCLVTAVGQRMFMTIATSDKQKVISIEAPDVDVKQYEKSLDYLGQGDIPRGVKFVEFAIKNFFDYCHSELVSEPTEVLKKFQDDKLGLHVTTKSEFSSLFGFGSSSASTVCVIKALSELFGLNLSNKEIFDLSYKTILDVQGAGSGFDIAAAIYGGTLSFVKGGDVIESVAVDNLPLLVAYSGVKADTVELVNMVAEKTKRYPDIISGLFAQIEMIVTFAKFALLENDWEMLGELMSINQGYLEALGVSTNRLSSMIYAARESGAFGAKLSGAGGGDCIIALVAKSNKQKVTKAIEKAGGKVIEVETNAEGVRVES